MIKSFRSRETEALFHDQPVLRWQSFEKKARRRLGFLQAATCVEDLMRNPSNRLHALAADRAGQYAGWINSKWRLCFRWIEGHAYDVEIVDYH